LFENDTRSQIVLQAVTSMTVEQKKICDSWKEVLQQQGFGRSDIDRELITILDDTTCPMSVAEIRQALEIVRPGTGRASVYRFVKKLIEAGLLRQVHGYRNCNCYIPSMNEHQMLLICTQCDNVSYLSPNLFVNMMKSLTNSVAELKEYHITSYHLQILGTCTSCKSNQQ